MQSPSIRGVSPLKKARDGAAPRRLRIRLLSLAMFSAILLGLFMLYGRTIGKPLPYSQSPKTPLIVILPGYGTLKGTQVLQSLGSKKALDTPVDAWLGLEYAKQPVGDLRFAPPEWPDEFNKTKDASEYGPICIQSPGNLKQSEACLNFNIYRKSGVPYTTKLPAMVFFHGGSFVGGHGRSFDGATFVSKSQEPLMVVTMQYRLAALGSLPSQLFEEEGLLNLDLLDQRLLLLFLQKYISEFGGDPDRITLAGQSAGGHSVGVHLFHNYGYDEGKPLFSQAIMSSGSPTARAFPKATYPLYERQFREFMDYLDCPLSPNERALACLRAADMKKIQSKQAKMYAASTYNITWPFQPVSPGPLLKKRGSKSGEDGSFFPIPVLVSSTTDEGKLFAPKNLTTAAHFTKFMANMNPGLTDDDLTDLQRLYPDPGQQRQSICEFTCNKAIQSCRSSLWRLRVYLPCPRNSLPLRLSWPACIQSPLQHSQLLAILARRASCERRAVLQWCSRCSVPKDLGPVLELLGQFHCLW